MREQQRPLIAVAGRTFEQTFSSHWAGWNRKELDGMRTRHRHYDISEIVFRL
jgi:hypothetical protein